MKRGLNYTDRNTLKLGLRNGWSIQQIATECRIGDPAVIQRYLDSMDPGEVEELKSAAPVSDIAALKEELKRELLAEMRGEPVFEDYVETGEEDEEEETDAPPSAA